MKTKLEESIDVYDSLIRHQTYLERYGSGLANRVLSIPDNEELIRLISSTKNYKKRIEKLLKGETEDIKKLISSELRQMARLEIKFTTQLIKDFKNQKYSADEINEIIQLALDKPLVVSNNTPADLFDSTIARKEQIAKSLNDMSFFGTKTAEEIAFDAVAMFSQFANGMNAINKTFAFSVASEMRSNVYARAETVEREVMSAVLDGRTTRYCMSIDGDIFKKGEGPRPPFHTRCRTIAIPLVEGIENKDVEKMLSDRSSVGPGEDYEKGDAGNLRATKAQLKKGKVDITPIGSEKKANSSYGQFLKSQVKTKKGKQFILDKLGIKRGNYFIKQIENGVNPDKLMKEIFDIKASDLDLNGLEKRINA